MGTGLGSSLLFWNGRNFQVVGLEFGHTQLIPFGLAHPEFADERALIQFIGEKLSNNLHMIEWEDICSGRGLQSCYQFFSNGRNLTAAESERAHF